MADDKKPPRGILQEMIRVAVGLDDIEDIKADLLRGLSTLAA